MILRRAALSLRLLLLIPRDLTIRTADHRFDRCAWLIDTHASAKDGGATHRTVRSGFLFSFGEGSGFALGDLFGLCDSQSVSGVRPKDESRGFAGTYRNVVLGGGQSHGEDEELEQEEEDTGEEWEMHFFGRIERFRGLETCSAWLLKVKVCRQRMGF